MKALLTTAILALSFFLSANAQAQVPAHTIGTACITETFWCWASTPGKIGDQCACGTYNGPKSGIIEGTAEQVLANLRKVSCTIESDSSVICKGVRYVKALE